MVLSARLVGLRLFCFSICLTKTISMLNEGQLCFLHSAKLYTLWNISSCVLWNIQ